jgi:hypothetical protein
VDQNHNYNVVDNIQATFGSQIMHYALRMELYIPYILESHPHPLYSFRELKNQMQIRIECGLDLRSRAGFWKNDRAGVLAFCRLRRWQKLGAD